MSWEFDIPDSGNEFGLVVTRLDDPNLFILNPAARFIWVNLKSGGLLPLLAKRFAEHFGIPLEHAQADIDATLASWHSTLLAEPKAEPATDPSPLVLPPINKDYFVAHYSIGSARFSLVVDDPECAHEIAPRLAHLRSKHGPTETLTFRICRAKSQFLVFCGEALVGSEAHASAARTVLLQEIARNCRPGTEWLTILHAAACGNAEECVVLAAATNSGKSTLSAALMQSGLHLFSDDSAAIDRRTRRVVDLPFALMLREGSWAVLESYYPELAQAPMFHRNGDTVRFLAPPVDGQSHSAAPKALVFVRYLSGATTQLTALSAFEALLGLQKSGFWVPHNRESIASFLAWLQSVPAYELTYSSLPEAINIVRSLLANK